MAYAGASSSLVVGETNNNLSAEMNIQGWVTPAIYSRINYLIHRKPQTDFCILVEKRKVVREGETAESLLVTGNEIHIKKRKK